MRAGLPGRLVLGLSPVVATGRCRGTPSPGDSLPVSVHPIAPRHHPHRSAPARVTVLRARPEPPLPCQRGAWRACTQLGRLSAGGTTHLDARLRRAGQRLAVGLPDSRNGGLGTGPGAELHEPAESRCAFPESGSWASSRTGRSPGGGFTRGSQVSEGACWVLGTGDSSGAGAREVFPRAGACQYLRWNFLEYL